MFKSKFKSHSKTVRYSHKTQTRHMIHLIKNPLTG